MKRKKKSEEQTHFKRYSENDFNSLLEVGLTLSSERDIHKIIHFILEKAIDITSSDSASIYLMEKVKQDSLGGARPGFTQKLRFLRSQNRNRRSFDATRLIEIDESSVAGYVALSGQSVRVRDVYRSQDGEFPFLGCFKKETSYRTKSVLAVPVRTSKGKILGVLQLVNKLRLDGKNKQSANSGGRPTEKEIIAFSAHDEKLMQGFASQAAVALENAKLTQDISSLFESFVRASVTAIEARDPTTSGHSDRVAELTVGFAETIDRISVGPYEKIVFSEDQIRELRYAALLHDFGKIGVKEDVLLKSKKLYPNELESILLRLQASGLKNETMIWKKTAQELIHLCREGDVEHLEAVMGQAFMEVDSFNRQLNQMKDKIYQANEPQVMSEDFNIKKLIQWLDRMSKGLGQNILTQDEAFRLSISKGTLSENERKEIESHVSHTYTFLSQIAWTDDLSNVAEIAHAHHEKLDGSGYPRQLRADQIPLQARMMTIADIYDALTAMDRPYKKSVTPERALEILQEEAKIGKLDRALLDVFIETKIWQEFAGVSSKVKRAA